jgi:hypothetical protein
MSVGERPGASEQTDLPGRNSLGRAVDRPVFWWSVGGIFLANACLSAAEGHWVPVVLQTLTSLWAGVAAVTARLASPGSREGRTDGDWIARLPASPRAGSGQEAPGP